MIVYIQKGLSKIFKKQKGGRNMIKCINHQVIEITDTDNRYYDRAFFVLRPECASIQRQVLEKEARQMLKNMDTMSTLKPKNFITSKVLNALLNIAIGSLITIFIYAIF